MRNASPHLLTQPTQIRRLETRLGGDIEDPMNIPESFESETGRSRSETQKVCAYAAECQLLPDPSMH